MLDKNFFSFTVPKIDQKEYEANFVKYAAFSGNLDVFRHIVNYIGLGNKNVLDLASGDGSFGKVAHDMGAKWDIDAIDFSIPNKSDSDGNYKYYNKVYEEDIFKFNFGKYDYVIANHFFEHLYINQILDLTDRFGDSKLIISVPLAHLTLAYNRFYLKAAMEYDNVEKYDYLIGGMHKTCFDKKLKSYLKFKKVDSFNWCQILVKEQKLTDKDKYMAQLYVTMTQEKFSYKILNNLSHLLLLPLRKIKKSL